MWWREQNLDRPFQDDRGHAWHVRVWHDFVEGRYLQQIFFWDEQQRETGVAEFRNDQALDVQRLRQRIRRLVRDAEYRHRYLRPLSLPVERHYGSGAPKQEMERA